MEEKKNRKQKDMRTYILGKAFSLMAKKGIKDISMREIAGACGVTKPVLYYYFKDKDDLCYSLISAHMKKYNDSLRKLIDSKASLSALLEHLFGSVLSELGQKDGSAEFALHFHSYVRSNPPFRQKIEALKRANDSCLEDIFRKELQANNMDAQSIKMFEHMIGAVFAHMVMNINDKVFSFDKNFPKDMTQCILKAISYKELTEDAK